ncbi:DUF3048 domain-containing protein [candidate division WWE3 bacterium]|jgi:hypothetical protein|uniref:DUF3048 domain-containing protein n=1 Tax=candidate division WWE3 bacterium TaxID=2053526 RepID=A0A3A4ZGW8_UNCKA|nr:MAG: DUF3048 domain-containing protein [candidate division WWE3 bacterium]
MDLNSETFSISPEQQAKFYTQNPNPLQKFNNKKYILFGIITAVILIGGFLFVMSQRGGSTILSPIVERNNDADSAKQAVMNPLSGEMVDEEQAASWKDERPMAVMINNYIDARPQSGLEKADLVYEIVAEGGITRFLAFFLSEVPEKIGPVRSTREYYLVLVKELGDAMIMHIGWSPQALEAIETWPVRSLGRGGGQFWRDQARIDSGIAIEHTAYVNGVELRELGHELGWEGERDFVSWKFKDSEEPDTSQQCLVGECDKPITIDFWYEGDYSAIFKYDRNSNSYLRFTGYDANGAPAPHLDQESQQQLSVKNLIVQFVSEIAITGDDKNRLEYELVGSGESIVFLDGKAIKATWSKAGRDDRTLFYDTNGQEILFNRGPIWVSIVPDRNVEQVVY